MKRFKIALITMFSMLAIGSIFQPAPVYAQGDDDDSVNCSARFLTFPAWYRGLPQESDCGLQMMAGEDSLQRTIWVIGLNVVEIIIQLVGYVCIAYIMIGGWRYLLSNGSPDGNVRGRKTILNAVIGLIIAISSVAIVNTIVNAI